MTFNSALAYMRSALQSAADAAFLCRTVKAQAQHRANMLAIAARFQADAAALASK